MSDEIAESCVVLELEADLDDLKAAIQTFTPSEQPGLWEGAAHRLWSKVFRMSGNPREPLATPAELASELEGNDVQPRRGDSHRHAFARDRLGSAYPRQGGGTAEPECRSLLGDSARTGAQGGHRSTPTALDQTGEPGNGRVSDGRAGDSVIGRHWVA